MLILLGMIGLQTLRADVLLNYTRGHGGLVPGTYRDVWPGPWMCAATPPISPRPARAWDEGCRMNADPASGAVGGAGSGLDAADGILAGPSAAWRVIALVAGWVVGHASPASGAEWLVPRLLGIVAPYVVRSNIAVARILILKTELSFGFIELNACGCAIPMPSPFWRWF